MESSVFLKFFKLTCWTLDNRLKARLPSGLSDSGESPRKICLAERCFWAAVHRSVPRLLYAHEPGCPSMWCFANGGDCLRLLRPGGFTGPGNSFLPSHNWAQSSPSPVDAIRPCFHNG